MIGAHSDLESVLEKVGRSLSDRFGIRVVCRGNECCTDGKTIFLPSLPDDLPEEVVRVIRGYLDHEAGHILGKSNFRIGKWFGDTYGDEAFSFLNMLEDLRIEELMRQRFPGSRRNLQAVYDFLVGEMQKKTDVPILGQLAFGVCSRGNGRPDLPFVNQEVYSVLDEIKAPVRKSARGRNTKQVARLAEAAWPVVQRLFPPLQLAGPGFPGGNGQGIPASLTGSNNTLQSSSPDPATPHISSGAVDPAGASQGGSDPVASNGKTAQTPGGDPAGAPPQNSAVPSPQGIMQTVADAIVSLVDQHAVKTGSYRVWSTDLDRVETAYNARTISYHDLMGRLLPQLAGVRQKLLQCLLAEPKARWSTEKETGCIDPHRLHRLCLPACGDSAANRVFRQRVRTRRVHTAVTLLVDQSNSMNRTQMALARDTALVFCEALSRLNIPCSVIGFSTGRNDRNIRQAMKATGLSQDEVESRYRLLPLHHIRYKNFDETLRAVSGRFEAMHARDYTPLGESILFAARDLASRREERKALFVMTDGMPVVRLGDDSITCQHAKDSIKRVEMASIDVALIGILDCRVQALHNRTVIVHDLSDLPTTVMRQLHLILNRDRYQYV